MEKQGQTVHKTATYDIQGRNYLSKKMWQKVKQHFVFIKFAIKQTQ